MKSQPALAVHQVLVQHFTSWTSGTPGASFTRVCCRCTSLTKALVPVLHKDTQGIHSSVTCLCGPSRQRFRTEQPACENMETFPSLVLLCKLVRHPQVHLRCPRRRGQAPLKGADRQLWCQASPTLAPLSLPRAPLLGIACLPRLPAGSPCLPQQPLPCRKRWALWTTTRLQALRAQTALPRCLDTAASSSLRDLDATLPKTLCRWCTSTEGWYRLRKPARFRVVHSVYLHVGGVALKLKSTSCIGHNVGLPCAALRSNAVQPRWVPAGSVPGQCNFPGRLA